MAETRYTIKHNGHTWWTTDADVAERFAHSDNAEIKAETMQETDIPGIPMQQLSDEQLQELSRIAQENEWWHIQEMAKDTWEVEQ